MALSNLRHRVLPGFPNRLFFWYNLKSLNSEWALQPIFCLCDGMELQPLIETTLTGLGYELVDLELSNRGRLIRIFIDKPAGVTVDDCALVSNHVSRLLAVEMDFDYDRLEVSSPGLDRPLRKEADFERFAGQEAQIRLRIPLEGQRKFQGVLRGVKDGAVLLEVEGAVLSLNLGNLEKARLVPRF